MNKSNINVPSAGTAVDSNSTAQNQHVSQPNANTNVVGSLFSRREIKFRAWDGNRIRDVFKILITEADGLIIYFKSTESGKEPGHLIERDSRLKLMQYTGLKDKNGKEIYEGDIVNYPFKNFNGKIIFLHGGFCIETNAVCRYDLDNSASTSVEVKGNVFENPELLQTLR